MSMTDEQRSRIAANHAAARQKIRISTNRKRARTLQALCGSVTRLGALHFVLHFSDDRTVLAPCTVSKACRRVVLSDVLLAKGAAAARAKCQHAREQLERQRVLQTVLSSINRRQMCELHGPGSCMRCLDLMIAVSKSSSLVAQKLCVNCVIDEHESIALSNWGQEYRSFAAALKYAGELGYADYERVAARYVMCEVASQGTFQHNIAPVFLAVAQHLNMAVMLHALTSGTFP